jgi:hypothetical protein
VLFSMRITGYTHIPLGEVTDMEISCVAVCDGRADEYSSFD